MRHRLPSLAVALAAVAAATACGGSDAPATVAAAATGTGRPGAQVRTGAAPAGSPGAGASTTAATAAQATALDWPEFGLTPQRTDATSASTAITAANVAHLHQVTVSLPGTVDSSPVYLHQATIAGAKHNAIFLTTTYGKTLAVDANSGRILWTYTPPGYSGYAGSAQITTSTPIVDPDDRYIYAPSPEGEIHKLTISTGAEVHSGSWPAHVTLEPKHEKLAAPLNIDGSYLLAVTDGYIGDIPPYQGHVVEIALQSGRVRAVFNTLCANRRRLIVPSTCAGSDSGIWARAGALVEPGGRHILVGTGNGPYNGSTDFGDSWIELSVPSLSVHQVFTPSNQQQLNEDDGDLGTGGPALVSDSLALVGGKDGLLRLLDLQRLDGHRPSSHRYLGGEVQTAPTPGGGQLISQPAVWHHGGQTTAFVADDSGTAAYALHGGRLHMVWENSDPGTSPVVAGGLLYIYDPSGGGINVYAPGNSQPIYKLPGAAGHWNSPIAVDGHVIEPTGSANEHLTSGSIEIFSTP
jgi:outer membrane protein assembly factor BamB